MSKKTQGRRCYNVPGQWEPGAGPQPGDYWQTDDGSWYGVTPSGEWGNLSGHSVTEHEDGTITVSPSILVSDNEKELWHGYLERGVWREV